MKLSAVTTLLVVLSIPALASAHAGNSDSEMVHACIGNLSKIARIVGLNGTCISAPSVLAETPAHWSAVGPQGPKGDPGMPGLPGGSSTAPAARVTNTQSRAKPADGSLFVVEWDKELFDTADLHDAAVAPSRLTAPLDGIYQVNVSVQWSATGNPLIDSMYLWLFKNGTENYVQDGILYSRSVSQTILNVPGAAVGTTLRLSTLVQLSAGDFLEVGMQTLQATAILSEYQSVNSNEFSMVWVSQP